MEKPTKDLIQPLSLEPVPEHVLKVQEYLKWVREYIYESLGVMRKQKENDD